MDSLSARLSELHDVVARRCDHNSRMGWLDDRGARVRILGRHVGRISDANRTRGYSWRWGLEVREDSDSHGVGVWLVSKQVLAGELVEVCPVFSAPCKRFQLPVGPEANASESRFVGSCTFSVRQMDSIHVVIPFGYGCLYRRVDSGANITPALLAGELHWVATSQVLTGEELLAPASWPDLVEREGGDPGLAAGLALLPSQARQLQEPIHKFPPLGSVLQLGASPVHGTGVFCARDCQRGQVLEMCPVVHLKGEARELLRDYAMRFTSGHEPDTVLALGLGALFNHSADPQADWFHDVDTDTVVFVARREVRPGEEVFIDYGQSYFLSRGNTPIDSRSDREKN